MQLPQAEHNGENSIGRRKFMKRSEIHAALKEMKAMIREYRISLTPFCGFTPEEWKSKGKE